MKGKVNYDNSNHEANLKILSLQEAKRSTKYHGVV
jgi:hypothetical protein